MNTTTKATCTSSKVSCDKKRKHEIDFLQPIKSDFVTTDLNHHDLEAALLVVLVDLLEERVEVIDVGPPGLAAVRNGVDHEAGRAVPAGPGTRVRSPFVLGRF